MTAEQPVQPMSLCPECRGSKQMEKSHSGCGRDTYKAPCEVCNQTGEVLSALLLVVPIQAAERKVQEAQGRLAQLIAHRDGIARAHAPCPKCSRNDKRGSGYSVWGPCGTCAVTGWVPA